MPRVRPYRVLTQRQQYHNLLVWQTTEMTFSLDT